MRSELHVTLGAPDRQDEALARQRLRERCGERSPRFDFGAAVLAEQPLWSDTQREDRQESLQRVASAYRPTSTKAMTFEHEKTLRWWTWEGRHSRLVAFRPHSLSRATLPGRQVGVGSTQLKMQKQFYRVGDIKASLSTNT